MNTRTATVAVEYNGQNISIPMGQYATSVSYTDNASGESDSLDINIQDAKKDWLNGMPTKGATIAAVLKVNDWTKSGDNRKLDCGTFILDDFSFSGPPTTGTISGVSVPAASAFKETKHTKTWESVTISEIAQSIATTAGISVVFDVTDSFKISAIEQSKETDCEFLYKLCETYRLSMKVYNSKIIIYDRELYKAKAFAGRIHASDMESWSWNTTLAGTYTGEVAIGATYVDVKATCTTIGKVGNKLLPGTLATIVDPIAYVSSVTNTTESAGGANTESDADLAYRVFLAPSSYSKAGTPGSYEFGVKSYNSGIGDVVVANGTKDGTVEFSS